jgi:hypothetical protein
MTQVVKWKAISDELLVALQTDAPQLILEYRKALSKLHGLLSLLEMARSEGANVDNDVMTELQRIVYGRKQKCKN